MTSHIVLQRSFLSHRLLVVGFIVVNLVVYTGEYLCRVIVCQMRWKLLAVKVCCSFEFVCGVRCATMAPIIDYD